MELAAAILEGLGETRLTIPLAPSTTAPEPGLFPVARCYFIRLYPHYPGNCEEKHDRDWRGSNKSAEPRQGEEGMVAPTTIPLRLGSVDDVA